MMNGRVRTLPHLPHWQIRLHGRFEEIPTVQFINLVQERSIRSRTLKRRTQEAVHHPTLGLSVSPVSTAFPHIQAFQVYHNLSRTSELGIAFGHSFEFPFVPCPSTFGRNAPTV